MLRWFLPRHLCQARHLGVERRHHLPTFLGKHKLWMFVHDIPVFERLQLIQFVRLGLGFLTVRTKPSLALGQPFTLQTKSWRVAAGPGP